MGKNIYVVHKAKNLKVRSKKNINYQKESCIDNPYWKQTLTDRVQLEVDRLHRLYKTKQITKEYLLDSIYETVQDILSFKLYSENNYAELLKWAAKLPKDKIVLWISELQEMLELWADLDNKIEVDKFRNVIRLQKLLKDQLGD